MSKPSIRDYHEQWLISQLAESEAILQKLQEDVAYLRKTLRDVHTNGYTTTISRLQTDNSDDRVVFYGKTPLTLIPDCNPPAQWEDRSSQLDLEETPMLQPQLEDDGDTDKTTLIPSDIGFDSEAETGSKAARRTPKQMLLPGHGQKTLGDAIDWCLRQHVEPIAMIDLVFSIFDTHTDDEFNRARHALNQELVKNALKRGWQNAGRGMWQLDRTSNNGVRELESSST